MKSFLLIVMLLLAGGAAADDAQDILQDVQKKFNSFDAFCAEFTQTFYWKLADVTQSLDGTLCTRGREKFRINLPDQLVITDGETLWTLNKENNQIIIDYPNKTRTGNPLLEDFIGNYLEDYTARLVEESSNKQTAHIIMDAKTDDFVRQVELWVDLKDDMITKIAQHNLNENTTIYDIKSINTDVQLKASDFKYTPPENADIIDMR